MSFFAQTLGMPSPGIGVLALMAEGRSNAGIAARLYLSPKSVERHVAAVFGKLGLPPDSEDNRWVLAVIAFLRAPA